MSDARGPNATPAAAAPVRADSSQTQPAAHANTTTPAIGGPVATRILPRAVTVEGDAHVDAWALFDHRADTGVAGTSRTLRLRFSSVEHVESLAFFGAAAGSVSVRDAHGGILRAIPGLTNISLAESGTGWHSFAATTPVDTDEVLVDWHGTSPDARLAEVEVWGTGQPSGTRFGEPAADRLLTGDLHGDVEIAASPVDASVTRSEPALLRATLEVDPRVLTRAFLVYELEGLPHWTAAIRAINGGPARGGFHAVGNAAGGLQVEEIPPSALRRGENELRFSVPDDAHASSYRVRRLEIVGTAGGGTEVAAVADAAALDALTDRNAATGLSGASDGLHEVAWTFAQPSVAREVAFHVAGNSHGALDIAPAEDAAAKRTTALDGAGPGWHRVTLEEGAAPTAALHVALTASVGSTGSIDELAVAASPTLAAEAPSIAVTYPQHGECVAGEGFVRGFVHGVEPGARLSVNGEIVGAVDLTGAFEARVTTHRAASAWNADVVVQDAAGHTVATRVAFDACPIAPSTRLVVATARVPAPTVAPARALPPRNQSAQPIEDLGAPYGMWVRRDRATTLSFGGARIEIPRGAVSRDVRVTIRPLPASQVSPVDRAMTNVSPHTGGFRFGPHGIHFIRPIRVTLPYGSANLPAGTSDGDVAPFFYDTRMQRWRAIHREGRANGRTVVGTTDHFTDYIAATLAVPETPGVATFNPNSIHGLQVANPAAGVTLIQPPTANSSGTADLSFPIEIPSGRGGMQPSLALQYNSDHPNGWLGVGWNLEVSHIEVDTRQGVPGYDGNEHYLLDGARLETHTAETCGTDCQLYHRVVEGRFDRIERHGAHPWEYSWLLTDKQGVHSVYGASSDSDGGRLASVHPGDAPNIARWNIESTSDPFGNTVRWRYVHYPIVEPNSPPPQYEPYTTIYLSSIEYTSYEPNGVSQESALYAVNFGLEFGRPDTISSARYGFDVRQQHRLSRIDVMTPGGRLRSYHLEYEQPNEAHFGKSLLAAVKVYGPTDSSLFYEHDFSYFTPDEDKGRIGFSAPQPWGQNDGSALDASVSLGTGARAFVGVGVLQCPQFHVGGGADIAVDINGGQNALVDVDGDGLADMLSAGNLLQPDQQNSMDRYLHRNVLTPGVPRGTQGSFVDEWLSRAPGALSGSVQGDLGLSVGVHVLKELGGAGFDFGFNGTRQFRLMTDIEGDGRPDLLTLDNPFEVLVPSANVNVLLNPYTQGGTTLQFGLPSTGGEQPNYSLSGIVSPATSVRIDPHVASMTAPWYHRTDPVLQWTVPQYAGVVHITGAVSLPDLASRDGVTASIVLVHGPVGTVTTPAPAWTHPIAHNSSCEPGPGNGCGGGIDLTVTRDDRIYFYTDAGSDISGDVVRWTPHIEYTSIVFDGLCDAGQTCPLPLPSEVQPFDWGADLRLADPNLIGWTAASGGIVRVTGTLRRPNTSGVVEAQLYRRRPFLPGGVSGEDLSQRTTPLTAQDVDALSGTSDPPSYTQDPVGTCTYRLDANSSSLAMPINCLTSATDRIKPGDQLILSVVIPSHGDPNDYRWDDAMVSYEAVDWQDQSGGALQLDQPVGDCDPDPQAGSNTVPMCAVGSDHQLPKAVVHARAVPAIGLVPPTDPPPPGSTIPPARSPTVGWYRGWAVAEWNGGTDAVTPFDEQKLYTDDTHASHPAEIMAGLEACANQGMCAAPTVPVGGTMSPAPAGATFGEPAPLDRHDVQMWVGAGLDSFISGTEMRPSRVGGVEVNTITGEVVDRTDRLGRAWHSPGLRAGSGRNQGLNFTLAVIGGGLVDGRSYTDQELIDLDGDRRPDSFSVGFDANNQPVAQWQRQFQDVDNDNQWKFNHPDTLRGWPGPDHGELHLRETHTESYRVSLGIGSAASRLAQKAGPGSGVGAVLSALPSWGDTQSQSATYSDLIDINGDGLPDRVRSSGTGLMYQLNLGGRFGAPNYMSWPNHTESNTSPFDAGSFAPGTGSPVQPHRDALHDETTESQSLEVSVGVIGPTIGGGVTATWRRGLWRLMDVNGDGLPDQIAKTPGSEAFTVRINHGDSFGAAQYWYTKPWAGLDPSADTLTYDVGNSISQSVGFTGQGLIAWVCVLVEASIQGHQSTSGINIGPAFTNQGQLLFEDIDGDGMPDHVLKLAGDPNVYVRRNPTGRANLLRTVSRPFGGSFDLDYAREGNRVGTDDDGNPADMPHNQWVLSSVVMHDGRGNDYPRSFQYFGSGMYDRVERESYGFGHVETAIRNCETTIPDCDPLTAPIATLVEARYHNENYFLRGLPSTSQTLDATGLVLASEQTDYATPPTGANPSTDSFFPAALHHTTSHYENGSLQSSVRVSTVYDAVGNPMQIDDEGDTGTSDDDVRYVVTNHAYHNNTIWRATSIEARRASDSSVLRRRTAGYNDTTGALETVTDLLVGGVNPATNLPYDGNDPLTQPTHTFQHDGYGNVTQAVDPSGYTLNYTYGDITHAHVTSTWDSFYYTSNAYYDPLYGVPTTIYDANGEFQSMALDEFGRVATVTAPGDSGPPTVIHHYGSASASPGYASTLHQDAVHPSDPIITATFIDGLGRTIQTKKDAEVDNGSGGTVTGWTVSGLTEWDGLGRVAYQSQPSFTSTGPITDLTPLSRHNPTQSTYDSQSRVVAIQTPDTQTTHITYAPAPLSGVWYLATTTTDPLNRSQTVFHDARGRTAAVRQHTTIQGVGRDLITRYSYDSMSQLVAVTDAEGNVTTADYDTRGLMISLNNPDTGLVEYQYTVGGDLGIKVTPNSHEYDPIQYYRDFHRLREIVVPGAPSFNVQYVYGEPYAPNHGAGRIIERTDPSGSIAYQYDAMGNVTHSHQTLVGMAAIPSATVDLDYTWDAEGRMLSLTYPSTETVTYDYDAGGALRSVTGNHGMPTTQYVSAITYDEFGARASITYGNGVTTRYAHDATMRRLSNIAATLPGNHPLQNISFDYDVAGQLTLESNNIPGPPSPGIGGGTIQGFWYDELGQLDHSVGIYTDPDGAEHDTTLQMEYDAIGNITHQTQTSTMRPSGSSVDQPMPGGRTWGYGYETAHPHRAVQVGQRTISYDADGNQLGWNDYESGHTRQITWNGLDRITSILDDGGPLDTEFQYDGAGNRTHKVHGGDVTMYAGQFYTLRNGAQATQHVFAGDTRVAATLVDGEGNEQRYWYHSDQLQSVQYVTDETGAVAEHAEYFPFGDGWINEAVSSERLGFGFTGKPQDEETGLYDFGARQYDAAVGQWLSADPAFALYWTGEPNLGVFYPLNGALYSYVWNSPINLRDPDGRFTSPNMADRRVIEAVTRALISMSRWTLGIWAIAGSMLTLQDDCGGCSARIREAQEARASNGTSGGNAPGPRAAPATADAPAPSSPPTSAPAPNVDGGAREPETITVYRVEAPQDQRINIDAAGLVSIPESQAVLWLNFGNSERARQFQRQRILGGRADAVIRSFEVPRAFAEQLAASAVHEREVRASPENRGSPIIGDRRVGGQIGLRPEQVELLRQVVIQGSGRVER